MANYLGSMSVKLSADYATLQSDLGKAAALNARFADDMQKKFNHAAEQIGKAMGIAVVASAGALVALTKSAINSADEISKLSQKVGISTESLSALKHQAGLAGVEIAGLQTGMVKFSRAIVEAAGGSKEQAETFKAMGISLRGLDGNLKSTEELFAETAEAFASYEDGAAKTALAVRVFGKAGADLIPMLNEGAEGIAKAAEEARAYGIIVDGEAAKAAEQFNDNLDRLTTAAQGFGNQLAQELLPTLVDVTDALAEGAKQGEGFSSAAKYISDSLKGLVREFFMFKAEIENATNQIGAFIGTLEGSGEIILGLANNVILATRGLAAAASGDFKSAAADFRQAGVALEEGWESGTRKIEASWMAASDGMTESGRRAQEMYILLGGEIENVNVRAQQFRNVMSGVASDADIALTMGSGKPAAGGRRQAPIIPNGGGADKAAADAKKLADEIQRLNEAVDDGAMKMADLADSFIQYLDPMDEETARFAETMRDISRAASEQAEKIEELRAKTGDAAAASAQHAQLQDEVARAVANATVAHESNIVAINREKDVTGRYVDELAEQAKLIGLSAKQQRVEAVALRALAEAKKLNVTVDVARIRQMAAANIEMQDQADLIDDLIQRFGQKSPFEKLSEDIEAAGKALEEAFGSENKDRIAELTKTVGELRQQQLMYATDAIGQGISSLKTMATEGSRAYEALGIAQQAVNVVSAIGAIVNQGNGDPYTAFARMAAMAAAVAQLVDGIGSFAGSGFSDTAAKRQAAQGTGSVLGDAEAKSESIANAIEITADATTALVGINRGMLRALQSLQAGIGAGAGLLARGAADVEFGDLAVGQNSFWTAGDVFNILGGKSKITDQGIIIFGGALTELLENISIGAYQEVQSRSWAFGSTHTREGITDITDEFGRQFSLIMNSIADTVREGALALGLLPADIEAAMAAYRVEEIRISLKDLTAEEQQAELAAVFSEIFDGLAGAIVPFIEQFQQVGEGLGETLVRVATGVQVTQQAMRYLGIAIDETDPEKFAQISESLIGMVGGIDAMIEGMQSFMSTFASDAHRLQVATDALNSAFAQSGLTVPATAEGMWELMQTFDATTEEGREQIATLLRLSSTAREYYDLLEKAQENLLDYMERAGSLGEELGESGNFQFLRAQIEGWTSDTIKTLNDLARAAGRAGASEQDLVNVHKVAAQRIAQLIAQLKEQASDLAVQLGYISQGDTLESLNSQIAAMGSASGEAADAIGSAVDSMREKMNLLLGDLSPFNDQRKLEIALQGLREGSVDPQQVLEIGRRLYASTSNYTNLFNQVMGMASFGQRPGSDGMDGGGTAEGRTLAELIAARDALLAAQRPDMADDLAHRIAELSVATGEDFAEIAEGMGFELGRIAEDMQISDEALLKLLETYREQFEAQDWIDVGDMITAAIDTSRDAIVAAIQGKPVEDIIAAADERMAERDAETVSHQAELAAKIDGTNVRLDALTSTLVSVTKESTEELLGANDEALREAREHRLFLQASGNGGAVGQVLMR